MPILDVLLSRAAQGLVPESVRQETSELLPLARSNPAEFLQRAKRPPNINADVLASITGSLPLAGSVRTVGTKVFKDASKAAAAANPWQDALLDRIAQGAPMRRSALRPAIRYASGDVAIGSPSTGHGSLWEAVTPAQQKGAIDGYVDAAGRFVTRDQGTILSGSLDSIKAALQNTFLER